MVESGNQWSQPLTPNLEPNYVVEAALRQQIATNGPITFADFMNACLHQEGGYYASGRVRIDRFGAPADFITAPEAHPAFSATVATVFYNMWQSMRRPNRFDIIESGAGNGTLARDALGKLAAAYPDMYETVNYGIVEQSRALIQNQQERLVGKSVSWIHGDAIHLPLHGVQGVFYQGELLDTIPFHRFIRRQGNIKEKYVTMDDQGNFTEMEGVVSVAIPPDIYKKHTEDNLEFNYSPAIDEWHRATATALDKGYIFTVDYGTLATGQALPWQPRVYSDRLNEQAGLPVEFAYQYPGATDITAAVDFDHLRRFGRQLGLKTTTHTTQAQFLLAHGFKEELEHMIRTDQNSGSSIEPMTHYFSSYPIIDPQGMGNFEVLIQRKNEASSGINT